MSDNIVSADEDSLKTDIRELVRKTVQETLNALLDEEAGEMVGAERYERTAGHEAYRSGHYKRKLVTTSDEVVLDVPKLRGATFQTAVIERYRRRETSVEEAFPEAKYQRCTVHFYRNVFAKVPKQKRTKMAEMLKVIHAQESREGIRGQGRGGGRLP